MESISHRTTHESKPLPKSLANLDPAFIDGLQAALIVIDRGHHVLSSNKFAQDWVKRTAEEMRGQSCYHVFHGSDGVCDDCPSEITFRTGQSASTIHTGLDSNGETLYAQITTHPIKDKRGRVTYVIEWGVDVSERVRFEQQLLAQNKRLSARSPAGPSTSTRSCGSPWPS